MAKTIGIETDLQVAELLRDLFEANVVPNVARNVAQRDAERALTYLLGAHDALNTLLVGMPADFVLRRTAEKIREAREVIKKEVR